MYSLRHAAKGLRDFANGFIYKYAGWQGSAIAVHIFLLFSADPSNATVIPRRTCAKNV